MGKLAVAGTTVVLGGGTAVGGVVLSKMFSFDSTLPETVDVFKGQKDGEIEGCVRHLFPGIKSMAEPNDTMTNSDQAIDKDKKEDVTGCLIVNWDKKEYGEDSSKTWNGKFRLLWAVQQEDKKGFIVFTTAETTDDSNKQWLWKGVAYSLDKKKDEGWKLSKKKLTDSNGKKVGKDDTDTKFPKPHSDLTTKPFWGLMSAKGNMDNICGSSSCTGDPTPTSFQGYGTWQGASSGKKLGEWTDKLTQGGEELFTKTEWDMSEVVKDMTGKGENKVWSGIDRPEK